MAEKFQQLHFGDLSLGNEENDEKEFEKNIYQEIVKYLTTPSQPSAYELLKHLEKTFNWRVRHFISPVVQRMREDKSLQREIREYLKITLSNEELTEALRGDIKPQKEYKNIFEELMKQSMKFRQSSTFREMIEFVAKFREYSPYNNMLVRVQNPSCSFFATAKDWKRNFDRTIKEDSRPMIILAPMSPVMLVYDLDSTEGTSLPENLEHFAETEGEFNQKMLERTLENAERDRIIVQFKNLSLTNAGFATTRMQDWKYKMRIVVHENYDDKSRYSILCHELAHIYLGHLGSDKDNWWPYRINLHHRTVEIEAEAVSYIVGIRAGLLPSSAGYLSSYLTNDKVPESVSIDLICKVTSRLENMGTAIMPARKTAVERAKKKHEK